MDIQAELTFQFSIVENLSTEIEFLYRLLPIENKIESDMSIDFIIASQVQKFDLSDFWTHGTFWQDETKSISGTKYIDDNSLSLGLVPVLGPSGTISGYNQTNYWESPIINISNYNIDQILSLDAKSYLPKDSNFIFYISNGTTSGTLGAMQEVSNNQDLRSLNISGNNLFIKIGIKFEN